jgi:anti-anti-sigma factor
VSAGELAELRVERDGPHVVAAIDGEVDPSNARDLGRDLTASVPNDAMGVVLDLTAVSYLDSAGVQMIYELAERLASRQQALALVAPPGAAARRVLEIVALGDTAPIAATRAEALSSLAT